MPKLTFLLLFLCCVSTEVFCKKPDVLSLNYLNGITLEHLADPMSDQKLSEVITKIKSFSLPVVIRVVFQAGKTPSDYKSQLEELTALNSGKTVKVYIMGEILDSEALRIYKQDFSGPLDCPESMYSRFRYQNRVQCFMDKLDKLVDIWEVGNEVNGEWADEGCKPDGEERCGWKWIEVKNEKGEKEKKRVSTGLVYPDRTADKIAIALDEAHKKHKPVALTLIDQPECITWSDNTMLDWAKNNLRSKISRFTLDYLFVSYYEDNCDAGKASTVPFEDLTPTEKEEAGKSKLPLEEFLRNLYWNRTFRKLEELFTGMSIGVGHIGYGEVGYSKEKRICKEGDFKNCQKNKILIDKKIALMQRYYGMQISDPKYIGGHFWWNAQEDIMYPAFSASLEANFKLLPGTLLK